MVIRRKFILMGGSLVGVALSGCTGWIGAEPPVEEIEITIFDVRHPNFGITSATVPIVLEVKNTHSEEEVPSPTIEYNIHVDDAEVASVRENIVTLGPGDSTREEFELFVDYSELGRGIVESIEEEEFIIRIAGTVESEEALADFESKYYF